MSDTAIKRNVLHRLMDLMDEHTRSGMKDDFLSDDKEPETQLEQHSSESVDEIVKSEKKDEEDPTDMPSVDPVVLLAKRFSK